MITWENPCGIKFMLKMNYGPKAGLSVTNQKIYGKGEISERLIDQIKTLVTWSL